MTPLYSSYTNITYTNLYAISCRLQTNERVVFNYMMELTLWREGREFDLKDDDDDDDDCCFTATFVHMVG